MIVKYSDSISSEGTQLLSSPRSDKIHRQSEPARRFAFELKTVFQVCVVPDESVVSVVDFLRLRLNACDRMGVKIESYLARNPPYS